MTPAIFERIKQCHQEIEKVNLELAEARMDFEKKLRDIAGRLTSASGRLSTLISIAESASEQGVAAGAQLSNDQESAT